MAKKHEDALLAGHLPTEWEPPRPVLPLLPPLENFRPKGGLGEEEEMQLREHCLQLQDKLKQAEGYGNKLERLITEQARPQPEPLTRIR